MGACACACARAYVHPCLTTCGLRGRSGPPLVNFLWSLLVAHGSESDVTAGRDGWMFDSRGGRKQSSQNTCLQRACNCGLDCEMVGFHGRCPRTLQLGFAILVWVHFMFQWQEWSLADKNKYPTWFLLLFLHPCLSKHLTWNGLVRKRPKKPPFSFNVNCFFWSKSFLKFFQPIFFSLKYSNLVVI